MEEIMEYYEYIVLAIMLGIFLIAFSNTVSLKNINKYFSSQQFRITSAFEIDSVSKQEQFDIRIFNTNINDARIVALGFQYKNKNIDYFQYYLAQFELGKEARIVIPSRDSIHIKVAINELKKIIRNMNHGTRKVKRLQVYTIDSLGITSKMNAKKVRTNIQKLINLDFEAEKKEKEAEQKRLREETIERKSEEKALKKARRKEKWQNFIVKIKSKLPG